MTISPGLINMHEHLTLHRTWGPMWRQTELADPYLVIRGLRAALTVLKQGITTVRELAAPRHLNIFLKRAIQADMFPGPRVLAAGAPLSPTGGHAWPISTEADGPDGMRRAVRATIKAGADWIKLLSSNDPTPEPHNGEYSHPEFFRDEFAAAVEAAHMWGRKITAHAMGRTTIGWAIDAGVDSIEHGIYLDEELAVRMVERNVALIPTLSGYYENTLPQWQRGPGWEEACKRLVIPHHQDSARIAVDRGVQVGVGTDTIGDIVDELKMLVECGMTPAGALAAATLTNAKILGLDDRLGTVEPGKLADLVVVQGDPVLHIEDLRAVEWVFQSGAGRRPCDIVVPTRDETADWTSLSLLGNV
jgi:imidazolonepropionase-like amidohydrolase